MTYQSHASSLLTKIAFSFVFLAAIGLCLENVSPYCHADDPKPLMAYVGTFSSPLKDTLPTQVDLPPGNGRGIHLFRIDRTSGAALAPPRRHSRARERQRERERESEWERGTKNMVTNECFRMHTRSMSRHSIMPIHRMARSHRIQSGRSPPGTGCS